MSCFTAHTLIKLAVVEVHVVTSRVAYTAAPTPLVTAVVPWSGTTQWKAPNRGARTAVAYLAELKDVVLKVFCKPGSLLNCFSRRARRTYGRRARKKNGLRRRLRAPVFSRVVQPQVVKVLRFVVARPPHAIALRQCLRL